MHTVQASLPSTGAVPTKVCTTCRVEYPATREYFWALEKHRLRGQCKDCRRLANRKYYERNADRIIQNSQKWCESNRGRRREAAALRRERDRESINTYWREWASKNRDKLIVRQQRRRANKLAAGGQFSVEEWQHIQQRCSGRCFYCDAHDAITADHFYPLHLGGNNHPWNILPACKRCNSSKRDREPLSWVEERWGEQALYKVMSFIEQSQLYYRGDV